MTLENEIETNDDSDVEIEGEHSIIRTCSYRKVVGIRLEAFDDNFVQFL